MEGRYQTASALDLKLKKLTCWESESSFSKGFVRANAQFFQTPHKMNKAGFNSRLIYVFIRNQSEYMIYVVFDCYRVKLFAD